MLFLFLCLLYVAVQLSTALPQQQQQQQQPPPTPTQSATATLSSSALVSISAPPASTTTVAMWPTPVSRPAKSAMSFSPLFAARIVVQAANGTQSVHVDSTEKNSIAVARWTEYFEANATVYQTTPLSSLTYSSVYLMPNDTALASAPAPAPAPGMVGLVRINPSVSDIERYRAVRSAMAFAIYNKLHSLIVYPDKDSTNQFDDFAPLPTDARLDISGLPLYFNSAPNPPISPNHGSISGIDPSVETMYPLIAEFQGDAGLRVFRAAFDEASSPKLSVVVVTDYVGDALRMKLQQQQKQQQQQQQQSSSGSTLGVAIQVGPILTYEQAVAENGRLSPTMIAVIAFGSVAVFAELVWLLFPRVVLGRWSFSNAEGLVITEAVQQAFVLGTQSILEQRARARAEMPKPVKSSLADIGVVVLSEDNKEQVFTRSGGTVSADNITNTADATSHPLQHSSRTTAEACSICIEEFATGDSVRVLPSCRHVFHAGCIDPWLTATSALCPLCKNDTRTSTEIADFDARLAAATAAVTVTATTAAVDDVVASTNINLLVADYFDEIIDPLSMERLGRIITRVQPARIKAFFVDSGTVQVCFTTSVFMRDSDQHVNGGWWRRQLLKLRHRYQRPKDLSVYITQRTANQDGNAATRLTAYPPPQSIPSV